MVHSTWPWCILAVLVSVGLQNIVVADDDVEVIRIITDDDFINDEESSDADTRDTTPTVTDIPLPTPSSINATGSVSGRSGSGPRTAKNRQSRTCGVPFKSPDRLVVGGKNAKPFEYPWMAALLTRHDKLHFCGGVLITDRHVLTAAHCFDGKNPTNVIVRLGEYNIQRNQGHIDYKVYNLKIHPEYVRKTGPANTYRNDVALVYTWGIAPYNEGIRPICLPPKGLDYTAQRAVATGWGRVDNRDNWAHVLQEVNLQIWRTESCNKAHIYDILPSQELCAGPLEGGRDTCDGDSGGPLILQIRGRWSVVGIVSWGPTECGSRGLPGVYTRVDSYLDWIISTVRGN